VTIKGTPMREVHREAKGSIQTQSMDSSCNVPPRTHPTTTAKAICAGKGEERRTVQERLHLRDMDPQADARAHFNDEHKHEGGCNKQPPGAQKLMNEECHRNP